MIYLGCFIGFAVGFAAALVVVDVMTPRGRPLDLTPHLRTIRAPLKRECN